MSLDVLAPISLPHFDTIFPFLRRAFAPDTSLNDNENRFDVQLAASHINPTRPINVLDVGCGDWLILKNLLQSHTDHFEGNCSYVGIDWLNDKHEFDKLAKKCCRRCFPKLENLHFDLTQNEGLEAAICTRGPFDVVVLMNVFHELPSERNIELFELLFSNLAEAGSLIIIDPDWSWCISEEAWKPRAGQHLSGLRSEWESNAVWLSKDGIEDVLQSMGFNVAVKVVPRTMHLWSAVASIPTEVRRANAMAARTALRGRLETQLLEERRRIEELRYDLRSSFQKDPALTGDLLVKTMKFFAACVSQCKRLETIETLR
ncbi:MAG TPA: methyltransferase domain-containing protein [Burkholderiales bacterium]|nr:methyltransferase domain-containing protein [Burkholderiales bacterium]